MKLAVTEAETPALVSYLTAEETAGVALEIAEVEVQRAVARMGGTPADAARALRHVTLLEVDASVGRAASTLGPHELRTLDALHAAAALSLGDDLDAVVTYDVRLVAACRGAGLAVAAPA